MLLCVLYLVIGGIVAVAVYFNKRDVKEITLGYPPGLFSVFEYFILVTCWPLVIIVTLGTIIVRMVKEKIL